MIIYKTLLQSSILPDIVRKWFPEGKNKPGNPQGLYNDILKEKGWAAPSRDNQETDVEAYETIHRITLQDGKEAGMILFTVKDGKRTLVCINIVEINNFKMISKHNTDKYEVVCWPNIQYLMEMEGFRENSYLINDEKGLEEFGSSAYFVNCDWLEKNTR